MNCSFIISKERLSDDQMDMIREHKQLCFEYPVAYGWIIVENTKYIGGYTFVEKFDMVTFLHSLGVDMKDIIWNPVPFELPEEDAV